MQNVLHSLAAKTTICGFVFVSDVTSQTGGGGEGALTLVAWKLLQSLHNTDRKATTILLECKNCDSGTGGLRMERRKTIKERGSRIQDGH